MNDGEIIENVISTRGMRWMHVVRMGAPVEAEHWLGRVPPYSRELVQMAHDFDPTLCMHHLRAWWPAREPVKLVGAPDGMDGKTVLFWRLDKGQALREGAMYAGVAYLAYFGHWPAAVRIAKLPEGATPTIDIYDTSEEHVVASLIEWPPTPQFFIILEG